MPCRPDHANRSQGFSLRQITPKYSPRFNLCGISAGLVVSAVIVFDANLPQRRRGTRVPPTQKFLEFYVKRCRMPQLKIYVRSNLTMLRLTFLITLLLSIVDPVSVPQSNGNL